MCMALPGIAMFCNLKLNIFNLGQFGGAHGGDCIL